MEKKNNLNHSIEETLRGIKFQEVSDSEKQNLWKSIELRVDKYETRPVLSPWLLANKKQMIPFIIGALLFVSAGGTVAASNSAVPGDVLYKVDRAVEEFQLAISNNAKKAELKTKFAEERVKEVEKIVVRSQSDDSDGDDEEVTLGINTALTYLNDVSKETYIASSTEAKAVVDRIIKELETLVNDPNVSVKVKSEGGLKIKIENEDDEEDKDDDRIEINNSGNKQRIEIREDGERIKIEIKQEGEMKIKVKPLGGFGTSTSATSSASTTPPQIRELEIEAKVFTDRTVVKVELNDRKTEFVTSATSSAGIITEVKTRFPFLTEVQIQSALEVERKSTSQEDDD